MPKAFEDHRPDPMLIPLFLHWRLITWAILAGLVLWIQSPSIALAQDAPQDTTEVSSSLRFQSLLENTTQATHVPSKVASSPFIPMALAGLLLLTILGWHQARQRLNRNRALLLQLAAFMRDRSRGLKDLETLAVTSAETAGWNRMLELCKNQKPVEIAKDLPRTDELRLNTLIEELPEGVAWTDDDGALVYSNPVLEQLLDDFHIQAESNTEASDKNGSDAKVLVGATTPQTLGQRLFALVQHDPDRMRKPGVENITGNSRAGERTLRVSRQRRRTSNGSSPGMIWTVRDITQQQLAERMRDEFLDSATHELRTPLANIKAYAETLVLSEALEIEQQKEFCNTINSEATRLARLIDDLLSISSMEVGGLSLKCRNTEVDRLAREVAANVRSSMEKKDQTFNVVISDKLPEMSLDADKFATVLVNLLGNASKYTPEGGSVTLRVFTEDNNVLFEVEDTGVGIAEEELPRVFDRFFRSSDPRVQNENGTGLGLTLTQELVRLHGGSLSVRSKINQGTCFTVKIPF